MHASAPCASTSSRKWRARQPLALQPPLHVGEAQQDGVDLAGVDRRAQLIEREGSHGRAPYPAQRPASANHSVAARRRATIAVGWSRPMPPDVPSAPSRHGSRSRSSWPTASRSGRLLPGERIPPERELAERLGVSRMTVRQALASLAARGLVERGVGRGTFVRRPARSSTTSRAWRASPSRSSASGLEAGARDPRRARSGRRPRTSRGALGLEPGRAGRCGSSASALGGGRPLTLEDSWLPAGRFPGLLELDLSGSLYALMRERYGLAPVERDGAPGARRGRARTRPRRSACAEGAPLMLVERVAYAADGTPVEFAHDRHRGDRRALRDPRRARRAMLARAR